MSTQALSAPISFLSLLLVQTPVAIWKGAATEQLTGAHLYLDIAKSGYLFHGYSSGMMAWLAITSWWLKVLHQAGARKSATTLLSQLIMSHESFAQHTHCFLCCRQVCLLTMIPLNSLAPGKCSKFKSYCLSDNESALVEVMVQCWTGKNIAGTNNDPVHMYTLPCRNELTHWGRDKMAAVSQTTFSNAFSWMKMYEFR